MSRKNVHSNQGSLEKYQPAHCAGDVLQRMMRLAGVATQTELAALLDVGKAAISDAKRRNMVPAEWFLKLCRPPHNASLLWLETGQGQSRAAGHEHPGAAQEAGAHALAEAAAGYGGEAGDVEHLMVPLARQKLAPHGGLETVSGPARHLFRKDWLIRRGDPDSMRLLRIMGDAMSPTLRDGDLVLLDESQREVFEGSIYALGLDGQVVLKRLARRLGGMLLISENRELYEPQEVPFPSRGVQVVGRVVWLSREL